MLKKITSLLFILIACKGFSQIVNEAPFILTIEELKAWTSTGPTADEALISSVPLAERFLNTETQLNPNLSNDLEIAYLPDGMNNFGNYSGEQSQFILYNFTNWAYIDKLVWFGGTADQTVQLPSAPWANAAHKNGVKIFGNIFFSPTAFGGSTATVLNFLEKDGSGNFIVLPKLVEIMEYYKFDGWFINMETSTTSAAAELMYEFVRDLTTEVEALGKEVMWYDAMLLNGNVGWQNRLNTLNSPLVQNDEDGNSSNGYEQRVSSNIFINFFWSTSSFPSLSRDQAGVIGRSEFEVFTGVDLWPGRNQAPFQTGGNNWMSLIHENPTTPFTSLGLFAPDCIFRHSSYTNFNNDPSDYASFYSTERHMFSGADRNPATVDATGFKGYANWMPAASVITQIPFETNFNTGHGLKKFEEGVETSNNPWHNMADQDILPTWQFAFSENGLLQANWDFENAYNGGSSLHVSGNLTAGELISLPLYKTELPITNDTKVDVVFNYDNIENTHLRLIFTLTDSPEQTHTYFINPGTAPGWFGRSISLQEFAGEELATLGFSFYSEDGVTDYNINIGNVKVHEGEGLGFNDSEINKKDAIIFYPKEGTIGVKLPQNITGELNLELIDIHGKTILQTEYVNVNNSVQISTDAFASGIYLLKLSAPDSNFEVKKKIQIK